MRQLTTRSLPLFCPNGSDELCILGGEDGEEGYISDGVILNVKTQEVTAINPACQIRFSCKSESFMEK